MNSALAAFVEGKSKSGEWWHRELRDEAVKNATNMPPRELRTQEVNERLPSLCETPDARTENSNPSGYFDTGLQQALRKRSSAPPAEPPLSPPTANDNRSFSESEGVPRPKLESREASTDYSTGPMSPVPLQQKQDSHGNDLADRIKATANRAAGLIQRGVGADGVLFLDATVGTAGSLIDGAQGLSTTETETDGSKNSELSIQQAQHHQSPERDTATTKVSFGHVKTSVILGSAYSVGIEDRVRSAIEQAKFSEKVLKSLLRRYPNGT
jgi:hypothetical protein